MLTIFAGGPLDEFYSATLPQGSYTHTESTGNTIEYILYFDDDQMRALMREIVNRLYTFHVSCDDPEFLAQADKWMAVAGKWDEPELDRKFLGAIKYEP